MRRGPQATSQTLRCFRGQPHQSAELPTQTEPRISFTWLTFEFLYLQVQLSHAASDRLELPHQRMNLADSDAEFFHKRHSSAAALIQSASCRTALHRRQLSRGGRAE